MSGTQITALGKYVIRGVLGKGAMGTVYDGWDPVIDRRVAIKTVRLPDAQDEEAEEGLARFKREAQAAGRLTHPNIVGVFDYGETEELAYIVMEFVAGRSLKEVLGNNERMTTDTILKLMDDVLAGLAFSHGRGVVHRDIKPANIMLTLDDQAKIADFGIARIEASSMTQAGTVLGTPAYMSPEQFMGQVVDRRTDIYSCGVLLYQLLTGDRPFDGSMTAIMHKVLTTTPPRPSELVVTSPAALDGVVAKAMARRPEDRYDTASEFAQAMRAPPAVEDAFASDETIVAPSRRAAPPPKPAVASLSPKPADAPTRSKLPVFIGGGAVAVAALAAAAWFVLPSREAAPDTRQASAAPPSQPASVASALQVPPAPVTPPATQQASIIPPPPSTSSVPQPAHIVTSGIQPPAPAAPPQHTATSPFTVTSVPPADTPRPVAPPPSPAVSPQLADPRPSSASASIPSNPPASPFTVTSTVPGRTPASALPALPSSATSALPSQPPSPAAPAAIVMAPTVPAPSTAAPPPPQFASTVPATAFPEAPRSNLPTPQAPPVRSPTAIEASLAAALPGVRCSLARVAVAQDGTATITGVGGQGQPDEALRRAVSGAEASAVVWQVQSFDGPYCPALDLLRPIAEAATRNRNGMEMSQAGGTVSLKDNDVIALQVTMPAFAGFLHVAYLQHDATVAPQVPGPGYPSQTYPARAQVELGGPRSDFEGWHVGPPFGTDMIVAIASTAPLFSRPLPDSQPLAAYLAALQTAMDALRRRGGSLAAAAVVLDTRP